MFTSHTEDFGTLGYTRYTTTSFSGPNLLQLIHHTNTIGRTAPEKTFLTTETQAAWRIFVAPRAGLLYNGHFVNENQQQPPKKTEVKLIKAYKIQN